MKIYTKTGDKGRTSLVGGKRVPKTDIRIEAYGTVDELIAHIGLLRDTAENPEIIAELLFLQNKLMVCASVLATDPDHKKENLPVIEDKDIEWLEQAIDNHEKVLPPLNSFILTGGHPVVSQCHISRTVCRRAERRVLELHDSSPLPPQILGYLNRLSDYLFMLSRRLSKNFDAIETPWKPGL